MNTLEIKSIYRSLKNEMINYLSFKEKIKLRDVSKNTRNTINKNLPFQIMPYLLSKQNKQNKMTYSDILCI